MTTMQAELRLAERDALAREKREEGLLEAVIIPRINVQTVARLGWGMATGNFHARANTIQLQGNQLRLQSASHILFQLDGENVGPLPVTFGVMNRALRIIVP